MRKITIIGAGSVGATIAYTLTIAGLASDIVLIDINDKKCAGEALDIRQGTPFFHPCSVYAGSYLDSTNSENLYQVFREIHRDGVSVIVVTHDSDLARKFDRQIVVSDGLVAENIKTIS